MIEQTLMGEYIDKPLTLHNCETYTWDTKYYFLLYGYLCANNVCNCVCVCVCLWEKRIFDFLSRSWSSIYSKPRARAWKMLGLLQLHLQSKIGILRKLIQIRCWNSERNWTTAYETIHTESNIFLISRSLYSFEILRTGTYIKINLTYCEMILSR